MISNQSNELSDIKRNSYKGDTGPVSTFQTMDQNPEHIYPQLPDKKQDSNYMTIEEDHHQMPSDIEQKNQYQNINNPDGLSQADIMS